MEVGILLGNSAFFRPCYICISLEMYMYLFHRIFFIFFVTYIRLCLKPSINARTYLEVAQVLTFFSCLVRNSLGKNLVTLTYSKLLVTFMDPVRMCILLLQSFCPQCRISVRLNRASYIHPFARSHRAVLNT